MLLLCASLQRQVFDDENKAAVRLMAGDNVEICRDLDAASFSVHNPVPDFIHCRCSDYPARPFRWPERDASSVPFSVVPSFCWGCLLGYG